MPTREEGPKDRARRIQQAIVDGVITRGLSGIDDPLERALYTLVCRYAGAVRVGDIEAAADAMEAALSEVRALSHSDPDAVAAARAEMRDQSAKLCEDRAAHLGRQPDMGTCAGYGVSVLESAAAAIRALAPQESTS